MILCFHLPALSHRRPLPHLRFPAFGEESLFAEVAVEDGDHDEGDPHHEDEVQLARRAHLFPQDTLFRILGSETRCLPISQVLNGYLISLNDKIDILNNSSISIFIQAAILPT